MYKQCLWCEDKPVAEVIRDGSCYPACRAHLPYATGESWWYELRDLAGIALIGAIVVLLAIFTA